MQPVDSGVFVEIELELEGEIQEPAANFTEASQNRNLEAGVLVESSALV